MHRHIDPVDYVLVSPVEAHDWASYHDAVEFHRKCGFAMNDQATDRSGHHAVLMTKPL